MANKTSFTPEEWAVLREAPHMTAMATAMSGSSGLFGTLAEGVALTQSLVEGLNSDNELIRSLTARDEAMESQKVLRSRLQELVQGKKFEEAQVGIRDAALARVREAVDLLGRKSPADVESYRSFVQGIGKRVAESAKEGGFLGFGGERVSAGEKDMLAKLDGALGLHSA